MCCLFGFMDYKNTLTQHQKNHLITVLSRECEARGTDATGVSYNSRGKLHIYKKPLPAHRLHLRIPSDATAVMGHTRMTTQGCEKQNQNNHPFTGKVANKTFALAHNGVLYNDKIIRQDQSLPNTKIETDSYIAVQLIEQQKALHLQSLQKMAEQVEGSFVFTTLDEGNNIYFVKGDNPLCLYHYPETGLYLYASTKEILEKAIRGMKFSLESPVEIVAECGDIVHINAKGVLEKGTFDCTHLFRGFYHPYTTMSFGGGWDRKSSSAVEYNYVSELKSIAPYFGYCPEDVDLLIHEGITPEEIEEFFYQGEL